MSIKRFSEFNGSILINESVDMDDYLSDLKGYLDQISAISSNIEDTGYSDDLSDIADDIYHEAESMGAKVDRMVIDNEKLEDDNRDLKSRISLSKNKEEDLELEKDEAQEKNDTLEEELYGYRNTDKVLQGDFYPHEKEEALKNSIKLIENLFKDLVSLSTMVDKLNKKEIEVLDAYINPEVLLAIRGKGASLLSRFRK
jgi:hypothetical protein